MTTDCPLCQKEDCTTYAFEWLCDYHWREKATRHYKLYPESSGDKYRKDPRFNEIWLEVGYIPATTPAKNTLPMLKSS